MTKHRFYTREESEDLGVHVAHCEERYKTVFERLRRIEGVLWTAVCGIVIGMGAIIGILFNRLFP